MSAQNSPAVSYSNTLASKFSSIFSFQTSTDSPCTDDNIYWICFSTITFFIFILMYNLHVVTNPETFDKVLSNTCGLATSVLITTTPTTPIVAI